MAFRRRQVDEPTVGEHEDALPAQPPFIHKLADPGGALRHLFQAVQIDLDIEVARVGEHRAVLHGAHVLRAEDVRVPRQRHEDVADRCGLRHRHHPIAVHVRFECLERVDFRDDHVRARSTRPQREAAAAPAVPRHHDGAPGDEQVRGPQNAVERRLACPVAVVEQMLRVGIVHGNDRELQHAVARHRLEPDDARRGFLSGACHAGDERLAVGPRQRLHPAPDRRCQVVEPVECDHMERTDQVRAIVHRDVGAMRQRRANVLVVGGVVLTLDREHLDPVVLDEMRGDVVLRRQGVRRAQRHVRAARLEGDREVGRLRGDVQTSGKAPSCQRSLPGEAFPQEAQHRHGALRPLGAAASLGGQAQVLDVGRGGAGRRGHAFTFLEE